MTAKLKVLVVITRAVKEPPKKLVEAINVQLAEAGGIFKKHMPLDFTCDGIVCSNEIVPSRIGFSEDQDAVSPNSTDGKKMIKERDTVLKLSETKAFVLFVVPRDQMENGTNGYSLTGHFVAVVTEPNGQLGHGDAHTWAHEIGHGLGLGHCNDESRLMHPYRKKKNSGWTGSDLDKSELVTVKDFLKDHKALLA